MYLSEKLKKICSDLGWTQKVFVLNYLDYYENTQQGISDSTLNHLFSGSGDEEIKPKLSTITSIVNFCKSLDNHNYKNVSVEYFLNDEYVDLTSESIDLYNLTGLEDITIKNIQEIRENDSYNILNNFINGIDKDFWKTLRILENINEYEKLKLDFNTVLKKLENKNFSKNLLSIEDIHLKFSNNELLKKDIELYRTLHAKLRDEYFKENSNLFSNKNEIDIYELYFFDKTRKFEKLSSHIDNYLLNNGLSFFVKNPYMVKQLKEHYSIKGYEEFLDLFKLLKKKLDLEYLFSDFTSPEDEFVSYPDLTDFEDFIKNEICIPLDMWSSMLNMCKFKNLSEFKKRFKYELKEYLDLYMNK